MVGVIDAYRILSFYFCTACSLIVAVPVPLYFEMGMDQQAIFFALMAVVFVLLGIVGLEWHRIDAVIESRERDSDG